MTEPPTSKEQIEGYLYAFKSLVKEHNSRGDVSLIRLIFDEDRDTTGRRAIMTGIEVVDADLKRPFKETTLDGNARGWFERLPARSIDEWPELRKQFPTRFSTRRAYLTETTRIVRKANETMVAFKERWTAELGFILDVPEIMKISSFMDAYKFPELAKRYSDKVPKIVDEMMVRHDDFVRSVEAFANTELPKGEVSESSRKAQGLLRRQLKTSLESGKLNHLIKDVRQRGRGGSKGKDEGKDKLINMIRWWPDKKKRKSMDKVESWMNVLITFPPISLEDISDEPINV
ncbi:reverse transcriptase domain-containing protein [Tanacetum coccineum]